MKKILFSATVYTHLANFHKPYMISLINKGYEVHAVANSTDGRKEEIEEIGVKCWEIPFSRSPINKSNFAALRKLKILLETNEYDLIHTHTPIASLIVRYAAKKWSNSKVIYTAHGFHFYDGAPKLNWIVYYPLEKIAKNWTDGLITINSEDFNRAKKMGFKENESLFLTAGVGVEEYKCEYKSEKTFPIRKALGIPSDNIVISYVAELNKNKNHIFLLRNWGNIHRKFPHSHLLIIGTGEAEGELKKYVEINNLKNIHFLGFRKDIPDILHETDIISLLSIREGLPKSIMEGMDFGLPAIVSNTRGLRDLVKNNVNGFIINHNDNKMLVDSFEKLLRDESLRFEMGKTTKELIGNYTLSEVLKEISDIYNKFLKN